MLKKRLGIEVIEEGYGRVCHRFKIHSSLIIPEGCMRVGGRAFWGCDEIKKVIIPGSVKSIGLSAFSGCNRLEEVEIPKSVEYIGYCAFESCYNATIILKKHKKDFRYIGPSAFSGVKDVKKEIRN